jgi:putative transcriptional regulator
MSESVAGKLLVASTILGDPNFFRSVVLVLQHDADGALGLVLNRPTESPVGEHLPLLAPRAVEPDVVFIGGPVEPEVAIALESASEPAQPTALDGVGIVDVHDSTLPAPCRVYSGYSGWGAGQLEDELEEEAWMVIDPTAADVFTSDPEGLWASVLKRQGGRFAMLATYPPDISLN